MAHVQWWGRVFQATLGVRIFFVISGFLITSLLLGEAARAGRPSLTRFYVRRVLRIFPVYYLFAAVTAVLVFSHLYTEEWSSWLGTLTFTRNMIGRGQSVTVHFWSVSVEEQFYLLWPITLVALSLWRRVRLASVILLAPVVIAPLLRAGVIHAPPGSSVLVRLLSGDAIGLHADALAIGCLGAFLSARRPQWVSRVCTRATLAGAVAGLVALAAWFEFGRAAQAVRYGVAPGLESLLILVAIYGSIERQTGAMYRVLNAAPVVWLGRLSYSLYVWQQLFLGHSARAPLADLAILDWRVWWLTALAAAALSYYVVERPMLALKDRLAPPSRAVLSDMLRRAGGVA